MGQADGFQPLRVPFSYPLPGPDFFRFPTDKLTKRDKCRSINLSQLNGSRRDRLIDQPARTRAPARATLDGLAKAVREATIERHSAQHAVKYRSAPGVGSNELPARTAGVFIGSISSLPHAHPDGRGRHSHCPDLAGAVRGDQSL